MKNIEDIIWQRESSVFTVQYAIKWNPNPLVLDWFLIDDTLYTYSTRDKQILALLITQWINPLIEVEKAYCYFTKDFHYIYKNNLPKCCNCKICGNVVKFIDKISNRK